MIPPAAYYSRYSSTRSTHNDEECNCRREERAPEYSHEDYNPDDEECCCGCVQDPDALIDCCEGGGVSGGGGCVYRWRWSLRILALLGLLQILFVMVTVHQLMNDSSLRPKSDVEVNATQPPYIPSPEEFLSDYQRYCRLEHSLNTLRLYRPVLKPMCPCISPLLKGRLVPELNPPPVGMMELNHTELLPGGGWRPANCTARHRLALIVPYRDREQHLRTFLHHMHHLLQRQMIDYNIFIVEQAAPQIFNKARMMNIGFLEAAKLREFDCFIFHDIDMLAEDDRNIYSCKDSPRHVGSHLSKWNYSVPYPGLVGGALGFTAEHFRRVNGYSNQFYGWGGEDDDMYQRIVAQGLNISRFPASVARFSMIQHKSDLRNPYNVNGGLGWKARPQVYRSDGLNSIRYKLRKIEYRPLYIWVYAEIPMPVNFLRRIRYSESSASNVHFKFQYLFCCFWFSIYMISNKVS